MNSELKSHQKFLESTAGNLVEFLGSYVVNIEEHYSWEFDTTAVPSAIAFDFNTLSNWFQKTAKLKELLTEKLAACNSFEKRFPLAEYFVVKWGRVGTNKNLKKRGFTVSSG